MRPTLLVTAKAPVPGLAKTRLAATVGHDRAADLAAAALLDTLAACSEAVGTSHCRLALSGDLPMAARASELAVALVGWTVVEQVEGELGERLAAAHAEIAGPVVQVGMDTPQVTPDLLLEVARGLDADDAVLGEATDGGWWVLAVREGRLAAPLRGVPMSTPTTAADTRAALIAAGLSVGSTAVLTDVDVEADAAAVAAHAHGGRFADTWAAAPVPGAR